MRGEDECSRGFNYFAITRNCRFPAFKEKVRHPAHRRNDGNDRLQPMMPLQDGARSTDGSRIANRRPSKLHDPRHTCVFQLRALSAPISKSITQALPPECEDQ
jgi:hypothetical protein